jgi:predicted nucleic acid-binding protein
MLGLAIILPHYAMYVFDTNVLVAGLRSRKGASFVILQALRHGLIKGAELVQQLNLQARLPK